MNVETFAGIVRAFLAFAGGIAISQGWIDESSWAQVGGAAVTLATVGWTITHHVTAQDPNRKTVP